MKFARKRGEKDKGEQKMALDLSNLSTPNKDGLGTDRSNTEGKKIERKPERSRHQLKHHEDS